MRIILVKKQTSWFKAVDLELSYYKTGDILS